MLSSPGLPAGRPGRQDNPTAPLSAVSPAGLFPGAPSANDDALIRAIARRIDAKLIFEFAPSGPARAKHLALELGDETHIIVWRPDAPDAKMDKGELARLLKPEAVARAETIKHVGRRYGEDAHLEFVPWLGECDLVLVDAARAHEDVKCDSLTALQLVKPGGTIVWCGYGSEPGAMRCLDELHRTDERLRGLRHIAGTSLCIWAREAGA
jgi:hypothetical protein